MENEKYWTKHLNAIPAGEALPPLLPSIEIETQANPLYAVIWLHGLGADGHDFAGIVPELNLEKQSAIRFIFPHAPMLSVTCNNGYVMPAWYDITVLDGTKREVDSAGVLATCGAIKQLIARENARGIPSQNIILAGFSQGGAIAYTAGLIHPEPLRGIIALSTYLPDPQLIAPEYCQSNRQIPIFAAHGEEDDVVPLLLGERARDLLLKENYSVLWQTYPMAHTVCLEEIEAIGAWINQRCP